ncbi:MBL fold metallo-hydrolase [Siminovitchia fortis]|uniref:MBL fold metallo-hydrolase n=1 Tax=Siminovitchia fortis TaxID=254758 RepID=A0A443J2J1_9BACI|nr:MBL fold metallo-hydrolase [Siminovitchia fortis]RWR14575.1 MBL fold metallo-hydrolase [Siminovitchia fortis]WHY80257.1 MBL fold metallo-hydrolase [Siminovitchia fortis]
MDLTIIGHWGGFPKAGEASSGYLLAHNGFYLLMDCGSAVLSKLQTIISAEKLDGIILSHYHADHTADIGVVQHALYVGKFTGQYDKTLPIYGHGLDSEGFKQLTYKDVTAGIAYKPDEILHIGPLSISFLQTHHSAPCFAMRIEADGKAIVYTGDTSYFKELADFSKGADVLLCESNFYKGMDGSAAGHMTSEQAGKTARQAGVDKLILTHLPHFGDLSRLKDEAAEQFAGEIIIAQEGLKMEI